MLIGKFRYSIDAKHRVFLPSSWRNSFGDVIYLTRGLFYPKSKCLYGMSASEWDIFCGGLARLSPISEDAQTVKRGLFSNSSECIIDKQGRIILPSALISIAEILNEVVLVGVGTHFEVWNPVEYEKMESSAVSGYSGALKRIAERDE